MGKSAKRYKLDKHFVGLSGSVSPSSFPFPPPPPPHLIDKSLIGLPCFLGVPTQVGCANHHPQKRHLPRQAGLVQLC